jgi:hypothetical protein
MLLFSISIHSSKNLLIQGNGVDGNFTIGAWGTTDQLQSAPTSSVSSNVSHSDRPSTQSRQASGQADELATTL